LVERFHDYLERSFLPGRTFASPADFNAQLTGWLQLANRRRKRSLGCAPAERIGADRAAMLTLPPVAPTTVWRAAASFSQSSARPLACGDMATTPRVRRYPIRPLRRDGNTFGTCVSSEEYDRSRLGDFWHERTDR